MLTTEELITTVALSILVLFSLLGNSIVIIIFMRNSAMRKPIYFLIANLAIGDILFTLFLIPRHLLIHAFQHPHGVAGDLFCKFITGGNLTWIGGVASVYSLMAISWERFVAVVHPYKTRGRFTITKAKRSICASWLASSLLHLPLFVVITYDVEKDFCLESWTTPNASKTYTMTWCLSAVMFPFCFMVFFYSRVAYALWRTNNNQASVTQQAVLQSRKKITSISFIVTLIYIITWLPQTVCYVLAAFTVSQDYFGSELFLVFRVLATFNAACNPYIYALQSQPFRKCVVNMLRRRANRKVCAAGSAFHVSATSEPAGDPS